MKEDVVDSDRIEGKEKQAEGELQEKWGQLKDKTRDVIDDVEDVLDRDDHKDEVEIEERARS